MRGEAVKRPALVRAYDGIVIDPGEEGGDRGSGLRNRLQGRLESRDGGRLRDGLQLGAGDLKAGGQVLERGGDVDLGGERPVAVVAAFT